MTSCQVKAEPQPFTFRIGQRGYQGSVKNDGVDIRLYYRSFQDTERLIESSKGIFLSKEEWSDLVKSMDKVDATINQYNGGKTGVNLMHPLGCNGTHLVVNVFNNQLFVHLRVYGRVFYDPDRLYPTKKGVAMNCEEWVALKQSMTNVTNIIFI